jgi:hypothetical protein
MSSGRSCAISLRRLAISSLTVWSEAATGMLSEKRGNVTLRLIYVVIEGRVDMKSETFAVACDNLRGHVA